MSLVSGTGSLGFVLDFGSKSSMSKEMVRNLAFLMENRFFVLDGLGVCLEL